MTLAFVRARLQPYRKRRNINAASAAEVLFILRPSHRFHILCNHAVRV